MASLREVEKTKWLLNSILDGTFKNPARIASPPAEGWGGDWDALFDSIPHVGVLDPEHVDDLRKEFGINKGKTDAQVDDPVVEEDLDPEV